ncbi:MAG: HAD hydrolase family protein [Muribaculaceae bacterium]|nr:HAD hydrolase family protein [Muribaculaceae bacterium]
MDLTNIRGIAFDVDGVLSPNTIPIGEDGQPCRLLNVKDGYAIQLAVKKGLKLAIISGGRSKAVALRYRNLGVDDVYMGAAFKLPIFEQWLEETGLDASEVIFVGDDIPDLRVMEHAGISVAPADAAWQVKEAADYISPCDGGHGVAREIIEKVLTAHGMWMDDEHAFGW